VAAQSIRAEARVVAELGTVLPCAINFVGAWPVSRDLLLLSRRLLQSVLGRSSVLHRGGASQELPWRGFVSARSPECPSLFSLPRPGASLHFGARRLEGDVVCR